MKQVSQNIYLITISMAILAIISGILYKGTDLTLWGIITVCFAIPTVITTIVLLILGIIEWFKS